MIEGSCFELAYKICSWSGEGSAGCAVCIGCLSNIVNVLVEFGPCPTFEIGEEAPLLPSGALT